MAEAVRVEGAQLKPAQRTAVAALESGDAAELTRARYEELTGVSRSQAAYDLAGLVDAGVLVRVGAGRATRYRLARGGGSERRRWTRDEIRAELQELCAGRTTWPSPAEFRSAGRSNLYVAASRYGGTAYWAAELGLSQPERKPLEADAARAPRRRRRAPLLAAAALALAAASVAAAVGLRPSARDAAAPAAVPAAAPPAVDAAAHRRSLVAALAAGGPQASVASLVLRARRGASWISVRTGTGRLVYAGTLAPHRTLRLHGKALWLRLGAAGNLDAGVDGGRARRLPPTAAAVVVTARGIRVVERKRPTRPTGALVSRSVAPSSGAPVRPSRSAYRPAPTPQRTPSSNGPAPLPAPAQSSGPAPLPPP